MKQITSIIFLLLWSFVKAQPGYLIVNKDTSTEILKCLRKVMHDSMPTCANENIVVYDILNSTQIFDDRYKDCRIFSVGCCGASIRSTNSANFVVYNYSKFYKIILSKKPEDLLFELTEFLKGNVIEDERKMKQAIYWLLQFPKVPYICPRL